MAGARLKIYRTQMGSAEAVVAAPNQAEALITLTLKPLAKRLSR
jgi:hypothetical protein